MSICRIFKYIESLSIILNRYQRTYPDCISHDPITQQIIYQGFRFSKPWFGRLKKRKGISLRNPTNHAQQIPQNYQEHIENFHTYIQYHSTHGCIPPGVPTTGQVGRYRLSNIANMDQIPLEFEFLLGATYESKGSKTVWVRSQGSGLGKRQATIQATIFGDGVNRVKPLIVFCGKGTKLLKTEKEMWDKRVVVDFQENAWVDENVMLRWLQKQWLLSVDLTGCPQMSVLRHTMPRMLVLDVHRAQKTQAVKDCMRRLHTLPAMVPPGCTSLVQPLDVCINKPLKDRIYNLAEEHYTKHLDQWTQNRYTASQR